MALSFPGKRGSVSTRVNGRWATRKEHDMDLNIDEEIAALRRLGVAQLRARYAELFGEQTRVGNKPWLLKRLAWRLQALAEGDLSERARRRAAGLAPDPHLPLHPPTPKAARS